MQSRFKRNDIQVDLTKGFFFPIHFVFRLVERFTRNVDDWRRLLLIFVFLLHFCFFLLLLILLHRRGLVWTMFATCVTFAIWTVLKLLKNGNRSTRQLRSRTAINRFYLWTRTNEGVPEYQDEFSKYITPGTYEFYNNVI